jgi:hypothetical protein
MGTGYIDVNDFIKRHKVEAQDKRVLRKGIENRRQQAGGLSVHSRIASDFINELILDVLIQILGVSNHLVVFIAFSNPVNQIVEGPILSAGFSYHNLTGILIYHIELQPLAGWS